MHTDEHGHNWMNHLVRMKGYEIRFYRINEKVAETKKDLRKDGTRMWSWK
jgi:hypothetical protein